MTLTRFDRRHRILFSFTSSFLLLIFPIVCHSRRCLTNNDTQSSYVYDNALNASLVYQFSSDYNYEFMVPAMSYGNCTNNLTLHWNEPMKSVQDGIETYYLSGQIVHESEAESAWLGLGISNNTDIGSNLDVMNGSEVMIGNVSTGGVNPYYIEHRESNEDNVLVTMNQTLDSTLNNIIHHQIAGDGHFVTTLSFHLRLGGSDGFQISREGENVFYFLVGSSSSPNVDSNTTKGMILLDFSTISSSYPDLYKNCHSDDENYDNMKVFDGKLKFYWSLITDRDEFNSTDKIDDPASQIKIQVKHKDKAWVGIGLSTNELGLMKGSLAVIGRPSLTIATGEAPLKYHLFSKSVPGIVPMKAAQQTLVNASIQQRGHETIMQFSKLLEESGEPSIYTNTTMTFIYAIGDGNILSNHKTKGSFQLKLDACFMTDDAQDNDLVVDEEENEEKEDYDFKFAWMIHGILATVTFAIAIPIAIASSYLRVLIPSTWIYLHAYSNLVAFTLSIVTFGVAVSTVATSGKAHFTKSHHILGLIILLLMNVQLVNAILRPRIMRETLPSTDDNAPPSNKKIRSPRQKWFLLHRSLGILILLSGMYQVGDGLRIYSETFESKSSVPSFSVYLFLFMFLVIILKIISQKTTKEGTRVSSGTTDLSELQGVLS